MKKYIQKKSELISYFYEGCKPPSQWKVGTEHEKFPFHIQSHTPVSYDEENGIKVFLTNLLSLGGEAICEKNNIIGIQYQDGSTITLEPGGQLELSGAPLETIHETCLEVHDHLNKVKKASEPLSIGFFGMGAHPATHKQNTPIMPKSMRYTYMREHFPTKGIHGTDMMLNTCTVQANYDFSSEEDMSKKVRVAMALQPIVTALFACSPFWEGHPTPYKSFRSHIWKHTDPDRCGILPFVFDTGFGFESYTDYALNVPLFTIKRNNNIIKATHYTFQDFMDGKIVEIDGELPTIQDWEEHLTTLFPEVRIKKYIEMRGADCGPSKAICALPAFWTGLLYNGDALDQAYEYIQSWTYDQVNELSHDVSTKGLQAQIKNKSTLEVAKDILDISISGLRKRKKLNTHQLDETIYLDPLLWTCQIGKTPAEEILKLYYDKWGQNIDHIYAHMAY